MATTIHFVGGKADTVEEEASKVVDAINAAQGQLVELTATSGEVRWINPQSVAFVSGPRPPQAGPPGDFGPRGESKWNKP